jgi:hypothetical protein
MGIAGIEWRCPICNIDVGGSFGELKNHAKRIHSASRRIERVQDMDRRREVAEAQAA